MDSLLNPNKKNERESAIEIYDQEPREDLSISDVVELAIYRSKFHKAINDLENSNDKKERFQSICGQYKIPITKGMEELNENDYTFLPKLEKKSNSRWYYDELSFYSYLLVSMRTDETQRKFVQLESQLFKFRVSKELKRMNGNALDVLKKITPINLSSYHTSENQYRIPFQEIFPYIDVTKCSLKKGIVSVSLKDLDSFFTNLYTNYLNKKIASFRAKRIHESSLIKVLIRLFDEETGNFQIKQRKDYSRVLLDEIPTVSRSFPPCMRNMYETLKTNHKLKHMGRLHFGLFIKGIGLSLDESLKFWRTEMLKLITSDEFDKQYAYNIRYNYGKEGSCKNRNPYTCAGIIREAAPAAGEAHGCPFKYMTQQQLESLMKKINPTISQAVLSTIIEKARSNPGIACATCFNALHPKHEFDETGISHPNVYFSESEERFKEEENAQQENE